MSSHDHDPVRTKGFSFMLKISTIKNIEIPETGSPLQTNRKFIKRISKQVFCFQKYFNDHSIIESFKLLYISPPIAYEIGTVTFVTVIVDKNDNNFCFWCWNWLFLYRLYFAKLFCISSATNINTLRGEFWMDFKLTLRGHLMIGSDRDLASINIETSC